MFHGARFASAVARRALHAAAFSRPAASQFSITFTSAQQLKAAVGGSTPLFSSAGSSAVGGGSGSGTVTGPQAAASSSRGVATLSVARRAAPQTNISLMIVSYGDDDTLAMLTHAAYEAAPDGSRAHDEADDDVELESQTVGRMTPPDSLRSTGGGSSGGIGCTTYSSGVGAEEQRMQESDYAPLDSVSPPPAIIIDDGGSKQFSPHRSLSAGADASLSPVAEPGEGAPIDLDLGLVTGDPLDASSSKVASGVVVGSSGIDSVGVPRFGSLGVYGALVLAQLCWSGFHLFAKLAFAHMSPLAMPMLRAWGTVPIMFCICYYQDKNFWRIPLADLKVLALISLLVCCGSQNMFNLGLMLTTAADGGITQPAVPVFAACMAIALKREKGGWLKMSGIACAVVGTVCIVIGETYFTGHKDEDDNSSPLTSGGAGAAPIDATESVDPGRRLLGIGCFMLQCFLFALYLLLQKPLLTRLPATTITFYMFLLGLPGTTAIGGYFVATMDWAALPPMWFVSIAYTILFATIAGFLLFAYATKHLPASASSMGITLQPLSSSLLGAMFLGEVLTWAHALGGLFLVSGLVIVIYSRHLEGQQAKLHDDLDAMRVAQDADKTATTAADGAPHSLLELQPADFGPLDTAPLDSDGALVGRPAQETGSDGVHLAVDQVLQTHTPLLTMSPQSNGAALSPSPSPSPSDRLQPTPTRPAGNKPRAAPLAATTPSDAIDAEDNPFDF